MHDSMSHRDGSTATREGFTLLEVLIVVIIAGTLTALALPYFGDSRTSRITSAYQQLHSDILLAQAASLSNPTSPSTIQLLPGGYRVEGIADPVLVSFSGHGDTSGVLMTWVNVNQSRLPFNHYGALDGDPDALDPRITLTIPGCPSALEVTLVNSSGEIQGEWVGAN